MSADGNLEDVHLLWLTSDTNVDSIMSGLARELRAHINHVQILTEEQQLRAYIEAISEYDRIVLICDSKLSKTIIPSIHPLPKILLIYIYCSDSIDEEGWTQQYTKFSEILVQMRNDEGYRRIKDAPMEFITAATISDEDRSTTTLNGQFVCSKLLIHALLRIPSVATDAAELNTILNKEYADNERQYIYVEEFQEKYSSEKALYWYTHESFLYKILNKALRAQNIELLFLLRKFIRDIHRQLKINQCKEPILVYRGQLICAEELKALEENVDGYISNSSFLSTSKNPSVAKAFIHGAPVSEGIEPVIFFIDAHPDHVSSMSSFADISDISMHPDEEEVLFMPNCLFRLKSIYNDNDGQKTIFMTLCDDKNDNELRPLIEKMSRNCRHENCRLLGDVLLYMGKFHLAEKYLIRALRETSLESPSLRYLYISLTAISQSKGDQKSEIEWLNKAIEAFREYDAKNETESGLLHNLIGEVHRIKDEFTQALVCYEKALLYYKCQHKMDYEKVDVIYANTSLAYQAQGKYSEALVAAEQALDIRKRTLPSYHRILSRSYYILGTIYYDLSQYELALENLQLTLKMRLKALFKNHPDLAKTYAHIGLVYEKLNDEEQAVKYFKEADKIYELSLGSEHPDVLKNKLNLQRLSK